MTQSRRDVLARAAGFALAPVAAAALPFSAARAAVGFSPPAGELTFERMLTRSMAGDAQVVVTRRYAIRFEPRTGGFRMLGNQVFADVEAPPSLAALARLEQERVETGLFPLDLDAGGVIVGQSEIQRSALLDLAVEKVLEQARAYHFASEQERREVMQFVRALQQSAEEAATELPPDLFAPRAELREDSRPITLPGGTTGHVSIRFTASWDSHCGLMRKAQRTVVTELADSRRLMREDWRIEHG